MPLADIKPGLAGRHSLRVQKSHLASSQGYPVMGVLSSMSLAASLELSCLNAVLPLLSPDEVCVGGGMDMTHQAATPPGFTIESKAELISVKGRKLVFQAQAFDGVELVSKATHIRYVVDKNQFFSQVAAKAARMDADER